MRIEWAPQAIEDLAGLRNYIAQDDPQAARRIALRIIDTVERLLPESARLGRPGRVPGTRELVIPRTPFIVPYRVREHTIEVLRVYQASRR